jgi:hypothetical protein
MTRRGLFASLGVALAASTLPKVQRQHALTVTGTQSYTLSPSQAYGRWHVVRSGENWVGLKFEPDPNQCHVFSRLV